MNNENNLEFKSGYIAVVGETNVGKSTLINLLLGQKLSLVTPKPQTTRKRILGILTTDKMQAIFIDTPGLHKGRTKLSKVMNDQVYLNIDDADLVILVVDVREKEISEFNKGLLKKINKRNKKSILILNKCDLSNPEQIALKIQQYNNEHEFISIFPISVLNDVKIGFKDESETQRQHNFKYKILDEIERILPKGPQYYDEDEWTDQTQRELASEIIRGKILKFVREEIPHGVFVEINKFKTRKTKQGEKIIDIDANIFVVKENHKGIIIGKKGEMLKKIGTTSRLDLEKQLDCKVNLQLWVKVQKDWMNQDRFIDKFKNI